MKHKHLITLLLLALCALCARAEEPIITLRTSIYETAGSSNAFHIELGMKTDGYVDVDCGFGPMEVEVSQAEFVDSLSAVKGTAIPLTVSRDGIVRIYGDASQIDYLYAEGCQLRSADIAKLTNLEILDLSHNELLGLDLTPNTKLQALYLDDNPFTESGLVVGAGKPDLTILEMGRIQRMGSFNLSDYPALVSFDAWGNTGLTSLDPTGCPLLRKLSIDSCPVQTLDVSRNTQLQILNVSDSRVSSLDLAHNPLLMQLYAAHTSDFLGTDAKMPTLDVSCCPNLIYLYCGGNRLRTLDISKNTYLQTLGAQENLLTTIDITHNKNLVSVSLQNNYFGFRDLPLPSDDWSEYYYYQRPMPMARCYKTGTVLDFSNQIKPGTVTTVALTRCRADAPDDPALLVAGEDYTWADGKITLLRAQSDSLQATFSNDGFTEYKLATACFMVKDEADFGQPSPMLQVATSVRAGQPLTFSVGMAGATAAAPKQALVDFGDGTRQTFAITASTLADAAHNIIGTRAGTGPVVVYMPEGETLTAFASEGQALTAWNSTKADRLEELTLTGAGLTQIDLATNRALRSLTLHGNTLGAFSLAGLNGAYEKTLLADLDLADNAITEFEIKETMQLRHFSIAGNQLEQLLALKDMDNAQSIDVSRNRLTTINILNDTALVALNCADNAIYQINLPQPSALRDVDIRGNAYTLANMPDFGAAATVLYAPQQVIKISPKGPGANLSAQVVSKDGATTQFAWVKEDGTPLTEGTDYTVKDGVTRFVNTSVGRVVCHITHAAWPQFAGADVLRTTPIEAAPMPTHVLATFQTLGDSIAFAARATRADAPLYINWSGADGDLDEYALAADTYTQYKVPTHRGATATVYTYAADAPVSVFGLYGCPLARVDVSALDQLTTLSISDAQLTADQLTLPANKATLQELSLDGNRLSEFDLSAFPALYWINLAHNQFSSFDFTKAPRLQLISMAGNQLESVKLNNPLAWSLDLANNALEHIDLTGVPAAEQIALFGNQLTALDVAPLTSLRYLDVSSNRMTIKTLPVVPTSVVYTYNNQEPLTVACVDGRVDLSAQAARGGVRTQYRWFIGTPTFDDNGELVGEELVAAGGDDPDPEYSVKGGITTFLSDPGDDVLCVMTNTTLPNLYLYTRPLAVSLSTGLSETTTAPAVGGTDRRVYSLDGRYLGTDLRALPRGIYVQGGKKVVR